MVAPSPRIVIFNNATSFSSFPDPSGLRQGIANSITIYLVLAFQLESQQEQPSAAYAWAASKEKQQEYAKKCHDNNIKILVSVGGGAPLSKPVSRGWDAVATAKNAAKFAQDNHLDGVDLDWEDPESLFATPKKALQWIVDFTRTLHEVLGSLAVISHTPGAPYLCPGFPWGHQESQEFYYKVDKEVGKFIDFYNVMFYDTGEKKHDYETVEDLIEKSDPNLPDSALLQIAHNSKYTIPINKLVIGKPVLTRDASKGHPGYMEPAVIAQSVQDAITKSSKEWNAGIMGWQYHDVKGFHDWADPSARILAQSGCD